MADEYLGPVDNTSPGQHGSNFNAPYGSLVAGRITPGTLDAVRQAIAAARERRRRVMQNVQGSGPVDELIPPESDGSVGRYANLAQAGLRTGAVDTAAIALRANPMGINLPGIDTLVHGLAARLGYEDDTVQPNTTGERYMSEGSRLIGGSIVPEAMLARLGSRVAARMAEGVSEASLSRLERMSLDYIRHPARVIAGNIGAAIGTPAGGDLAAHVDERLRPVGQIAGGLIGGGLPFAGRGHTPEATADEHLGSVHDEPLPKGPRSAAAPEAPVAANDGILAHDPVAPYRDQALREHAATHDLTPAEAAEMYYTNENPEFTTSVRDRANELYQKSVVDSHAPPVEPSRGREPESRAPVRNDFRRATRTEKEELGYSEEELSTYRGSVYHNPNTGETVGFDHHPSRPMTDFEYTDPVAGTNSLGRFDPETGEFVHRENNQWVPSSNENPLHNQIETAVEQAYDVLAHRSSGERPYANSHERDMNTFHADNSGTSETPLPPRLPEDDDLISGQEPPEPPSGNGGRGGDEPPPDEPLPPGDDGEPPHPSDNVVKRLTAALNSAGRVNKDQEALRTAERLQRVAKAAAARDAVGGEEGIHAALSELKGEMPKLDFEGVRDQFTPEETKSLFTRIRDTSKLRFFEQLRAALGLKKLLDGQLPNASELALLGRVFPKDFISAALRNRSLMTKIRDAATNTLNIPRALMSSVDLSAPLRQGLFLVGRKEFYKAWPTMFQQFVKGFAKDDHAFESFMDDIRAMPNYELMDEAKVFFGGVDHNLSTREEAFMSPYAEKIPVVGRPVKASERAYTAFLNKLRADTADSLIELHRELGIEPGAKELESIGRFINSATGRGNLGRLNSSAPLLNAAFFSPRLIKSRIDMLNPAFYATLSPVVRREAIKSLLSLGAITTTVLGLAVASGMRVETDMRSSDFGKIRNGDVRYDILGGFGQYLTLGARLVTNQTKSLDGQVSTLGTRYGARTRLDTLANFGRNKLAPIPSFVADYLAGKDATGQPFNLGRAAISRLTPLYVQDIVSVMQDKGPIGAAQSLPGMFGVGIQTIPPSHQIDHLGRHVADLPQTEADPAAIEIQRLNTNPNSQLIGTPRRTNVLIGDTRRNLTDEEYQRYQETAGRYIHQDLTGEMATPEWRRMSDDDKRQTIRDIVRDQRANARDELGTPDEPISSAPTASVNDEMITSPSGSGPAGREFSAAAVVSSLFPGIHVTQEHRDPNSRLGRANPDSWHNRGRQAVDVRPIRDMSFADYVDTVRRAGYPIIEQRDEVHNPSRWATGPHWHLVIGART